MCMQEVLLNSRGCRCFRAAVEIFSRAVEMFLGAVQTPSKDKLKTFQCYRKCWFTCSLKVCFADLLLLSSSPSSGWFPFFFCGRCGFLFLLLLRVVLPSSASLEWCCRSPFLELEMQLLKKNGDSMILRQTKTQFFFLKKKKLSGSCPCLRSLAGVLLPLLPLGCAASSSSFRVVLLQFKMKKHTT